MPQLLTLVCDVCRHQATEIEPGAGLPGWGALHGISLDGVPDPVLCPEHLGMIANHLDGMKHGHMKREQD